MRWRDSPGGGGRGTEGSCLQYEETASAIEQGGVAAHC